MSEYRLIIRVKNNLLHTLMVDSGIANQAELARAVGLAPSVIGLVANLKVGAFNADGTPSKATSVLCDYFGCLPEDIYPREVLHTGIPKNVIERVVSSQEVAKHLQQQAADPAVMLEEKIDGTYLLQQIARLTKRQQEVIKGRFFEDKTLAELGERFGVSRTRINDIERKALNKLRGMAGMTFSGRGCPSDDEDLNTRFAEALIYQLGDKV